GAQRPAPCFVPRRSIDSARRASIEASFETAPAMSIDNVSVFVLVAAVFALGGFVKGVIGLGLRTITMGMLGLALPPAQAAALLVVPSLLTNVWQVAGTGT